MVKEQQDEHTCPISPLALTQTVVNFVSQTAAVNFYNYM